MRTMSVSWHNQSLVLVHWIHVNVYSISDLYATFVRLSGIISEVCSQSVSNIIIAVTIEQNIRV